MNVPFRYVRSRYEASVFKVEFVFKLYCIFGCVDVLRVLAGVAGGRERPHGGGRHGAAVRAGAAPAAALAAPQRHAGAALAPA